MVMMNMTMSDDDDDDSDIGCVLVAQSGECSRG